VAQVALPRRHRDALVHGQEPLELTDCASSGTRRPPCELILLILTPSLGQRKDEHHAKAEPCDYADNTSTNTAPTRPNSTMLGITATSA
jgi:hypothetical protein